MSPTATKKTKKTIIAFYADSNNLLTRNETEPREYVEGETLTVRGKADCCSHGFHACINPLDSFRYGGQPDGKSVRLCLVELSGSLDREQGGDKVCGTHRKTLKIWTPAESAQIAKELREPAAPEVVKKRTAKNREAIKAQLVAAKAALTKAKAEEAKAQKSVKPLRAKLREALKVSRWGAQNRVDRLHDRLNSHAVQSLEATVADQRARARRLVKSVTG